VIYLYVTNEHEIVTFQTGEITLKQLA